MHRVKIVSGKVEGIRNGTAYCEITFRGTENDGKRNDSTLVMLARDSKLNLHHHHAHAFEEGNGSPGYRSYFANCKVDTIAGAFPEGTELDGVYFDYILTENDDELSGEIIEHPLRAFTQREFDEISAETDQLLADYGIEQADSNRR